MKRALKKKVRMRKGSAGTEQCVRVCVCVGRLTQHAWTQHTHTHTEWGIDVIVHPWIVKKVKKDNAFKVGVVELALQCIQEELGLKCSRVRCCHHSSFPDVHRECAD